MRETIYDDLAGNLGVRVLIGCNARSSLPLSPPRFPVFFFHGGLVTTYRIRNWDQHFENNRTRELKRMDWVPVPVKQDGDGYTELVEGPSGAANLGAWLAIVEVAAKCDPRGTLSREGAGGVKTPHTPHSLARMSHLPAGCFDEAIPILVRIGWLEICDNPAPSCGNPAPRCGEVTMEGKGREGNGMEENPPPPRAREDRKHAAEHEAAASLVPAPHVLDYETFLIVHRPYGLDPAQTAEELQALLRTEPANRWNQYGVSRNLGYLVEIISKRHKLNGKKDRPARRSNLPQE